MKNRVNDMVRIERGDKLAWVAVPQGCGQEYVGYAKVLDDGTTVKVYTVGHMPLEALPEDVQKDVRETLMVCSSCSVNYESGRFSVSPSTCIRKDYPDDAFACGTYHAADVFTPEERKRNYIETFGYAPATSGERG